MKIKGISLGAILLMLGSALGAQTTPYTTPQFSATFNGPVTNSTDTNTAKTSTDNFFSSTNNGVEQMISVRTVDHDIDMDKAATDFYAGQAQKAAGWGDSSLLDHKDGTDQGRNWAYVFLQFPDNTKKRRIWITIVNSRTVLMILQEAPMQADDEFSWKTIADSLDIRM
jgi:hypothetical protein